MSKRQKKRLHSNKVIAGISKKLDIVAEHIQKRIEEGTIDFSFEYKGNKIDILEELASVVSLMDSATYCEAMGWLLNGVKDEEILDLADDTCISSKRYRIINAISNVADIENRYLFLNVYRTKYKFCGTMLVNTMLELDRMIKSKEAEHVYGIEKSVIVSIIFWARSNGLYKEVIETALGGASGIVPRIIPEEDYLEALKKYNPKFGQVYYTYKIGEITGKEFSRELVTECGKLPQVRYFSHFSSPEFSWKTVEDIVGGKSLIELEVEDSLKEAISSIFQCFYETMLVAVASNFKYGLIGLLSTQKLKQSKKVEEKIKKLEDLVEKNEKKVVKAKETIKGLREEVINHKENEHILKVKIDKLEKQLESLESQGIVDVEPYLEEIDKLNGAIEDLNNQLDKSKRNHRKKETLISKLNSNNEEMSNTLEEKEKIIGSLRDKLNLAVNAAGDIPTSVLVNYLNKHKIVIHGGDAVHTQLKELGLKSVKMFKANESLGDYSIVKNSELLVIMTKQISHGMSWSTQSAAESVGIKTIYFNNMNCRKLCVELFNQLEQ